MTNSVCYKIYGQDFHIEPDSVQFANAVFHDEYRINDLRSHNVRTILDVGSHVGSFRATATKRSVFGPRSYATPCVS